MATSKLIGIAPLLAAFCVLGCTAEHNTELGQHDGFDEAGNLIRYDGKGNKTIIFIPTDERPVVKPTRAALPVSGGTLIATRDGMTAVAADPERSQVFIVDLNAALVRHVISFAEGGEPGRLVEDGAGLVHVVLRRGGSVETINLQTGAVVMSRQVCGAPRGIGYEAASDSLHVACADGTLVTYPAASATPTRSLYLQADLRDVIVTNQGLWVSTFRSARLLKIEADGSVLSEVGPQAQASMPSAFTGRDRPAMSPGVAWHTLPLQSGDGMVMLHQMASTDTVELDPPSDEGGLGDGSSYGGGVGGLLGCEGIVTGNLSRIGGDGSVTTYAPLAAPPLAVAAAISPDGETLAIAHAGVRDTAAPLRHVTVTNTDGSSGAAGGGVGFGGGEAGVTLLSLSFAQAMEADQNVAACNFGSPEQLIQGPAVAVAFASTGYTASSWSLLVQQREPAQLVIRGPEQTVGTRVVLLSQASVADTGHELFHRDGGAGIACASCHPEGTEDGHVWSFSDIGERRTQPLNVGLEGTAPFHWAGDLANVNDLMTEVFVLRMGGNHQSVARLSALESWLFSLTPIAPSTTVSTESVERGEELFHSSETECATCHSGEKLTNNSTVAVRPGDEALQVPSLIGIGYRSPFMHDGCADTLEARFDTACGGGDMHGRTEHLSDEQIADLVAYLKSL